VDKFYKNESRVPVRLKALSVLMDTYKSNRHIYEEDLLERLVLPFLANVDSEASEVVRLEAVKVKTFLFIFLTPEPIKMWPTSLSSRLWSPKVGS
jgi:hypothetical protein